MFEYPYYFIELHDKATNFPLGAVKFSNVRGVDFKKQAFEYAKEKRKEGLNVTLWLIEAKEIKF